MISTLQTIAIAAAAFGLVGFGLLRLGSLPIAAGCAIALFLLRFAALIFVDLEPLGELSTLRDSGVALPFGWVVLGKFIQFGFWGAVMAFVMLRHRKLAKSSAEQRPNSHS